MRYLTIMFLLSVPAHAADKAVILNDPKQAALHAILDNACRTQGLSVMCRNAFVLSDDIDTAGVVTETKPVPPAPDKKEGE